MLILRKKDKDFTGHYDSSYSDDFFLGSKNYAWTLGKHMLKTRFVFNNNVTISKNTVLMKLTKNANKDISILNSVSYHEKKVIEDSDTVKTTDESNYKVNVLSAYQGLIESSSLFFDKTYTVPVSYISLGLAAFTTILLANFMLISIAFKKKEIGILRSLGSTKLDTTKICLVEAGIIGLINFVLSLIVSLLFAFILNAKYGIILFEIGFVPIAVLLCICLVSTSISTIAPVLRLSKKRPIDIIENR